MKAFHFRGARILELRKRQADEARGAFMRAAESARESADRLAVAEAGSARAIREFRDAMAGTTSTDEVERHRNWIERQRTQERGYRKAHEEQLALADKAARVLQAATRQVKVMERLRERAERRYREAERQLETKVFDELATVRYARRRAGEGAVSGH
jgi:flagellar export protein FliJ